MLGDVAAVAAGHDRGHESVVFAPDRPGRWELETTHHGLRPLSPFIRDAYKRAFEDGIRTLVERYGLPLDGVDGELVHGCFYVRPRGLGEGDKPQPVPPKLVMQLLARLHPGMRRRNRAAARAIATKQWRTEVDRWFEHDRDALVERNLELQSVDLRPLDDSALAAELERYGTPRCWLRSTATRSPSHRMTLTSPRCGRGCRPATERCSTNCSPRPGTGRAGGRTSAVCAGTGRAACSAVP